jgi:hypothetical protein
LFLILSITMIMDSNSVKITSKDLVSNWNKTNWTSSISSDFISLLLQNIQCQSDLDRDSVWSKQSQQTSRFSPRERFFNTSALFFL